MDHPPSGTFSKKNIGIKKETTWPAPGGEALNWTSRGVACPTSLDEWRGYSDAEKLEYETVFGSTEVTIEPAPTRARQLLARAGRNQSTSSR